MRWSLWNRSCVMCGWFSQSGDSKWTDHAGKVHSVMLCPGHHVLELKVVA